MAKVPALVVSLLFLLTAVSQAITVGHPAPAFVLKDSHQQRRTLSEFKGKVLFINFWASWCAPCQIELPALNRLALEYRGKKVKVVAINVDQDKADALRALGKLGLTAPQMEILWDSKSKTVSTYDIDSMPSSLIVDSRGIIRFIHAGFHSQDPAAWRREIDSLR